MKNMYKNLKEGEKKLSYNEWYIKRDNDNFHYKEKPQKEKEVTGKTVLERLEKMKKEGKINV